MLKPKKRVYACVLQCVVLFFILYLVSCGGSSIQRSNPNFSAATSAPIPSNTVGPPSRMISSTLTPLSTSIIPTETISTTESQYPTVPAIQAEDTIPNCQNFEHPTPFSDLKIIEGKFFFSSLDRANLFSFGGMPPKLKPVYRPDSRTNLFSFSKDGKWLLAYSNEPESVTSSNDRYSIQLISKDGSIQDKVIDLSRMTEFIHDSGSETFFPLVWQFEWVDPHIVKILVGYGETRPIWYIFGYYDILQDTWWDDNLQYVPDREAYEWTDLSPDLTRLLYINSNHEIVLWDLPKQHEIWRSNPDGFQPAPKARWTSDSQKVAFWSVDKLDEIQLINRDGDGYTSVRKPKYPSESQNLSIGSFGFRWSPDNRLIAIWGIIRDDQNSLQTPMLYVYDLQNESYIFRCQVGESTDRVYIWNFFWSPDGSMLIPEHVYEGFETTPFRLYDIRNKAVYQYGQETFSAIGWVQEFADNWK